MPALTLKVTPLLEQLKQAYRAFTNAQFTECRAALDAIVSAIPLVSAASRSETNDLKELLDVSREYITAIR
jgi:coatomer protein complex subunit alpha (xenin)